MEKWETIEKGPFEPTWDSLRQYQCPEWFRDAKLGFWAHWGPHSVPMLGDWYARSMYVEADDQYLHHWRRWGHPSKHGWKDVCAEWKAEKFDPDYLMDLYTKAGARYFCALASFHDNYDNWDSTHNPMNSVNVGPGKDIIGLFRKSAREHGLPFGVTEHLGASFSWWRTNKGADTEGPYAGVLYDGNDPAFRDFYHDNYEESPTLGFDFRWYTKNTAWQQHWFDRMKDLIDKYKPDLLYTDGPLPFDEYGLGIVAHLYNSSIRDHGGRNNAVYTQKGRNPLVHSIGVLDIDRSMQKSAVDYPWQTDTCVGNWFYDIRQVYKTPKHVIEMFVDIVSRNGCLLLSLPILPDGTLDDECLYILSCLAGWNKINGEGIFGTRPWAIASEGDVVVDTSGYNEPEMNYTPADFRFTCKGKTVYAFQLGWPENGRALIKSFSAEVGLKPVTVGQVELLGFGSVPFDHTEAGLQITGLPEQRPVKWAHCFKITLR